MQWLTYFEHHVVELLPVVVCHTFHEDVTVKVSGRELGFHFRREMVNFGTCQRSRVVDVIPVVSRRPDAHAAGSKAGCF